LADDTSSLRLSTQQQRVLVDTSSVLLAPASYASEPDWHHAIMRTLMPLTGAYKSAIRKPEGGGFRMTPLGFEESAIVEHRDYYYRFDFGRALGERPALGNVFSRNEYYGPRFSRFQRTEYYADYISRYAVFDALCLSSESTHHAKGTVLYLWHEKELTNEARRTALAIMRLLVPAFCAGTAMRAQIDDSPAELTAALDDSSDGYALYDQDGRTLYRNRSLEHLMALPENGARLTEAMNSAVSSLRNALIRPFQREENLQKISARHWVNGASCLISACLLERFRRDAPKILVRVVHENRATVSPGEFALFSDSLGLTRREFEVASLLCERMSNQEIAVRLGISEHTSRHHTESVLRKLGVASRFQVATSMALISRRAASRRRA
jgi:DNA-binding CsgD family transcriptional regulator